MDRYETVLSLVDMNSYGISSRWVMFRSGLFSTRPLLTEDETWADGRSTHRNCLSRDT